MHNNSGNINNLCRVCLIMKPQTEMLSVNHTQMEKLLFIGDSNQIIRFNGQAPNLCIRCGINLDSVYDFIVKLRVNTLQMKRQEQKKHDNSPNNVIKSERKSPSQSHELTLPCESTVQNVVVHCKIEPQFAEIEFLPNQPELKAVSEPIFKVKSEHPEPKRSFLSVKSVDDLNSSHKSKSKIMLGHTVDSLDNAKQKVQSVDDSRVSSSLIRSKSIDELNSSLKPKTVDCLKQEPQSGNGSSSLTKLKPTDEVKSKTVLSHTVTSVEYSKKNPQTGSDYRSPSYVSIDATKVCQFYDRTFSSTSKILRHVHEYSGPGFSCPVEKCNFIFTHKANLEKHIKSHTVIHPNALDG